MRRRARAEFGYDMAQGFVATLLLPGSVGRLVEVVDVVKVLDTSAVSAAIDNKPYFSRDGRGGPRPANAWHMVKIHNFCRPLGAQESCCERTGGLMQLLWDKRAHPNPVTLMDAVLLREAGVTCTGSARDAKLCNDVVEALWELGRRPMLHQRHKRARLAEGVSLSRTLLNMTADEEAWLAETGRWAADDMSTSGSSAEDGIALGVAHKARLPARLDLPKDLPVARSSSCSGALPTEVPGSVKRALFEGLSQGKPCHRRVKALPAYKSDVRSEAKGWSQSEKQRRFRRWLESSEGKAFQESRKQRFGDV